MKTEEQVTEKIESIEQYAAKLSKWNDEYPYTYHAIEILKWVLEESTEFDQFYIGEP